MQDKPSFQEMSERIRHVMEFHDGKLPLEHALVWEGYLAALLEWQLISISDHDKLASLLGPTPAEPALTVFLGPEGAEAQVRGQTPKEKQGIAVVAAKRH